MDGVPFEVQLQMVRADWVRIWVLVKRIPDFENGDCIKVSDTIEYIDQRGGCCLS